MEQTSIQTVWIALLVLQTTVLIGLEILNILNARDGRHAAPSALVEHVDAATQERAAHYAVEKGWLSIVSSIASAVVMLVLATSGVLHALDLGLSQYTLDAKLQGVLFLAIVGVGISIVDLPFVLYRTFSIDRRYGFTTLNLWQWIFDLLKSTLISLSFLAPLLFGILWFMQAAGPVWWLYAFIGFAGFQLVIARFFPAIIAPIFNSFIPLSDGALRTAINELANRVGFQTSGIFVMDGSRRSTRANAYFTGIGKSRRIVLYDTLIQLLPVPQTVAVLAHEIGHAKLGHVRKMLFISLSIYFIGFGVLDLVLRTPELFGALGIVRPSHHAALLICTYFAAPLTFFLAPLLSLLSRRYEYQADSFAARSMNDAAPMISALLALSKKNLANLTPHPWYSFFHYSHPTLGERLAALSRFVAIDAGR
ncbi:MAG: M48 family peptidase [Proteobacteria bacterium]|nr:M48 family peptidase [Pseudomonadota bacterium]